MKPTSYVVQCNMGKLLQVAGFPCETTVIQLVEFLKTIFADGNLQNVWLDPYREQRAVAMFLHELDETRLCQLSQGDGIEFHDHILAFNTAKPTWSIFVRTYGSIPKGTIDKLGLTFQKKPSRMIQHIDQIDDDCFEITFSDGWDAVQEVCKKDWSVGKTKLSVCPYFECFKEPAVELHERPKAEEADKKLQNFYSKPSSAMNLTNSPLATLPNKPHTKLSESIFQKSLSFMSEATKDSNYKRSFTDFCDKTTVYFKHQCIPILLRCLHFEKALYQFDCHLNITEDEDNCEIEFEIAGPKLKVKKVAKLLDQVYEKVKAFKTRNDFFTLDKILPDLQKRINATNSVGLLSETGNGINLVVIDSQSNKVTFQDFVSSLVSEEEFSPLSEAEYQEDRNLIEQFNNDYKTGHIFVSDANVKLMFLSHKKHKMNVIIKLMKSKFKSASVNETKINKNNFKEEEYNAKDKQNLKEPTESVNDSQNQMEPADNGNSRSQENLSAKKSHSEEEKIKKEIYKIIENSRQYVNDDDKSLTAFNPADSQDYMEDDSTKDTQVKNIKDKMKGQTLTLICQNEFFVWLLDQMKFKEVVESKNTGTSVRIDVEEKEVVIKGDKAEAIKSLVLELDGQISFNEDEKTFLQNPKILHQIKTTINRDSMQLVLRDNLQCLVQYQDDRIKTFKDFALGLFESLKCNPLPNQKLQFCSNWTSFIEKINSNNPLCRVMVDDDTVTLLTVLTGSDRNTKLVKFINDTIKSLINNQDRLESQTELDQVSEIESDVKTLHLPMAKLQHDYCKMFLMEEFKNIREKYNSMNAHIELSDQGFEIKCIPSMLNSIENDLKQLLRNAHEDKHLSYPGLIPFIRSQEGKRLIKNIIETWECLITFPGITTSTQHQHVETFEQDSVRPDYRAVLIQTARCNGFKIHLVEGLIEDIESKMKVKFLTTQEEKAFVKTVDSSLHLSVYLPEWKVPRGETITYLKNLRESFKDAIVLVIEQAVHLNCANMAFSTHNLHSAEHPFPLDCLADTVTKVLKDLLPQVPDHSASSAVEEVNVYICETKCEAVFKAFNYFSKNLSASFGPPDQDVWDSLCPPNISKYPNYKKLPVTVEVTSYYPPEFERKSLFCYPILPSLDSASCPVIFEPTVSKRLLEESIKEIIDKNPDGLLINQHFKVRCFPSPRNVIVYCSPEWGLDSSKIIYEALERCLSLASEMEAVYIVPPGLPLPTLSTYQKYPARYMAITIFQALDRLLVENKINSRKKIVFVVANTKYEEVLKMELHRRYPQDSKKQQESTSLFSIAFFKNLLSGGSEKIGPKPENAIRKTQAAKIPVSFYCKSKDNINKAAETLDQQLRNLMSTNKEMIELDSDETTLFEEGIQDMQELNISFILERHFEEENTTVTNKRKKRKQNRNKQKKNMQASQNQRTENKNPNIKYILTGSLLKIQGLCGKFVEDFKKAAITMKSKKHFSDVNQTTDLDESDDTFHSDQGSNSVSGLNSLQLESSSVDPEGKAENNMADPTILQMADSNKPSFEWKYESNDASISIVFVPFNKDITKIIEEAYVEGNLVLNIDEENIEIDFVLMQATVDQTELKRKVIRSEILKVDSTITFPKTWTSIYRELHLLEIQDKKNEEFKFIQDGLSKALNTSEHKVHIIKIERVQNECLYKRFQTKLKLLKLTKSHSIPMWNRVLGETRLLVCEYGFHPAFSATRNEHLGNGVLFHTDAKRCLNEEDIIDGKNICLILSQVYQGKTGPGRCGLRAPPLDENDGLPCDSVVKDGDCMIFSDAHLYPCHSVIFKMQKKMSATDAEFFSKI